MVKHNLSIALEHTTSRLTTSSIQPRLVTDKPLPKLPRGWSRLRHESGVILRTLGLGIIISTYHGLFSKDFHEPRKIVIRKSRTTSLMRMSIHLIPMSVALLEIILNIRGCYLGSDFDRQSYLQFAAKAHELTVQASLGAMVFSFVRHQVSLGKGMPFGAFLSSLQFSQISYLWSTEFWSSLLAKNYRLAEKLLLFIIVVPCAIIAAVAGPSSATLLIPREGIWPANPSSHFSVNATFLDIWPDRLNGSEVPDSCSMLQASSSDTICPFSDWKSILQLLQTYAPYPASGWESSDHSSELYFSLTTEQTGFSKITQALLCTSSTADQFCASSLQEAILYGLDDAFNTWFESVSNTTSFADLYTSLLSNYYEPYGIISCVADYIDDSNRKDPVTFARISETNDELAKPRVLQSLPSLTKDQALNVSRNVSEYHLSWLELPQPMFNGNAFGAIILSPQDHQTDSSGLFQNITACTLKAGWGTSAVRTDASEASEYYSTITGVPSFWPTYTFNHQGAAEDESDPNFANFSGYQYPQRLINISPDWAAFLNPLMANGNGTNTTLINTYLMATITPASETDIAKLLGIMLTSGLGRNGVGAAWQAIDSSTPVCKDCLKFEAIHALKGWSYNIQSTASKLSAVVMIAYCVLATLHIIYSGSTGISSSAWDSNAEVVALAMNSQPTAHLKNTCGGIVGVRTFRTSVAIRATRMDNDGEEHLELKFGHDAQEKWSKMKMNREYG